MNLSYINGYKQQIPPLRMRSIDEIRINLSHICCNIYVFLEGCTVKIVEVLSHKDTNQFCHISGLLHVERNVPIKELNKTFRK